MYVSGHVLCGIVDLDWDLELKFHSFEKSFVTQYLENWGSGPSQTPDGDSWRGIRLIGYLWNNGNIPSDISTINEIDDLCPLNLHFIRIV